MIISKRNSVDYILLIVTIAVSGFPFFSNAVLLIPLFVVLFSVMVIRKFSIGYKTIIVLILLALVIIIQTLVFNFYSISNIVGVFLRVLNGILIVVILKQKFVPYYVNVLYYLAIISLVLFFPIVIAPPFKQFLLSLVPFFDMMNLAESQDQSIVLYNINLYHLSHFRNSGPFWEPGAFAGYLVLAYIFSIIKNKAIFKKQSIVILIAILTTMSTTAFLALFVFFICYIKINNIALKGLAVIAIIGVGYFAFFQLDFIGAKIEKQITRAQTGDHLYLEDTDTGRFLSILRDMEDIKGHELFGRGAHPKTRFSYQKQEGQIRTVGLTDILVRMGGLFFLFMLFLLYNSIKSLIKYYDSGDRTLYIGTFLAILTLLMSQTYFQFPIFWSLLFLPLAYSPPKTQNLKT